MAVLKAILSGGTRRDKDFYPTPPEATRALLSSIESWPRNVLEPACGDGAICRILEQAGFRVRAQDLVDRGYGTSGRNFLHDPVAWAGPLITNPPFNLAAEFILRAHEIGVTHMALLLKADFWHAARRLKVWDAWPPYAHLPMTFRLDFTGAGAPHTNCSWFLWDRTSPPLPRPLEKPADPLASFLASLDAA